MAYQVELDLAMLLVPRIARNRDEGRGFVRAVLGCQGHASVDGGEIHVCFPPTGDAQRDQTLRELCGALDATATRWPPTGQRIRYRFTD
jgi:hypothetical protein